MRHLIDSNILVYMDLDPCKLTDQAKTVLADPANELLLSIASLWELQIKINKGKLKLSRPLSDVVLSQWETNGVRLLSIQPEHVFALTQLPAHHGDPFDRLLIAQAKALRIPVVTSDSVFASYGLEIVW